MKRCRPAWLIARLLVVVASQASTACTATGDQSYPSPTEHRPADAELDDPSSPDAQAGVSTADAQEPVPPPDGAEDESPTIVAPDGDAMGQAAERESGTGTPPPGDASTSSPPSSSDANTGVVPVGDAARPPVEAAAPPRPDTTRGILGAQSASCLSCAEQNGCLDPEQGGGVCDTLPGNARSGGLTERALCLKTLNDIIVSRCAAELLLTKCLCGMTSTTACLAGTEHPTGPVYANYVDDLGSNIADIQTNFDNSSFGVGQANVIVDCVTQLGCGCAGD